MDMPTPSKPVSGPRATPGTPIDDDESFLDDAFARIVDMLESSQRPDPTGLAFDRPHLLPRIRHLIQLARAVSPLHAAKPPVLPGYEVLSRLGAGGMGEVFLCRQTKMGGRPVAVKVLSESFSSSSGRLEMLRNEAMALARLRHPGVVDVYEFVVGLDEDDNTVHAFAMQWIQGCSLAQWSASLSGSAPTDAIGAAPVLPLLAIGDRSPLEFACRTLVSVARTVHAVHVEGLLHRDLKPSNILLRDDGSALVSDFGLARDIHTGSDEPAAGFSGTRVYASPEQCRGDRVDARSDIYSLGMTLRNVLPEPVPPDLGAIIAKATAPLPEHRYGAAAELATDIERFLAHVPVLANPPGPMRRCAMFVRRNRRATLGTSLGALCMLFLAGAIVTGVFIAPRRADSHLALARLELLSPGHANAIWNAEWYRQRRPMFDLTADARARAADAYRAALRWRPWGRWSRDVRAELAVVEGGAFEPDDLHLSGLAAYLAGDSNGAINAWSRLAAREDPDAFTDGALGVAYLVREQHALAYPRLEHAHSAFPRVGFLAVYHADAAVGCGDLDRAERLLDEAASFDNQDDFRAALRVRADLLLARGRLEEAQEAILRATLEPATIAAALRDTPSRAAAREFQVREALRSPIAASRLARIAAARGNYDGAASALGSALALGLGPESARAEFARYVDRWWECLGDSARRREIRRAMDLDLSSPESLIFRLRHAHRNDSRHDADSTLGTVRKSTGATAGHLLCAVSRDFASLRRPHSAAPLAQIPRVEIAARLDVDNPECLARVQAYSTTMKCWQLVAWNCPMPRTATEILARIAKLRGH